MYFLTAKDLFLLSKPSKTSHFLLDCYVKTVFQGIMPNTSAAKILIVGKNQFKALQFKILEIELDTTYVNEANICFKSRMPLNSIGIV